MLLLPYMFNESLNISLITSNRYTQIEPSIDKNITTLSRYKNNTLILHSSNMLLSLFSSLPISNNADINENIMSLYEGGLDVAGIVGITTPYREGKDHRGVIFSPSCTERWMAYLGDSDDIKPIRCHHHTYSSLNFWINEPNNTTTGFEFAIFSINIPALVKKYFFLSSKENGLSIYRFLINEITSNVLEDITAVSIFNYYQQWLDILPETNGYEAPRSVPTWIDVFTRLNAGIDQLINLIYKGSGTPDEVIKNIALKRGASLFSIYENLPYIPTTKQITPDHLIAELPLLFFILYICNDIDRFNVSPIVKKIKTTIKTLEQDRSIYSSSISVNIIIQDYLRKLSEIN